MKSGHFTSLRRLFARQPGFLAVFRELTGACYRFARGQTEISAMKVFWAWLLIPVALLAFSQTVPQPAKEAHPHLSTADFGVVYPLSNDWVRATQMIRKRVESDSP